MISSADSVLRHCPERAAWLLAAGLCVGGVLLLPHLDYAFDEGVYIQQALRTAEGQRIYVDFFGHQTPLYPLFLALPAWLAPDSLLAFRLPSLLAFAACGLVVQRIARRVDPGSGGLLATLLFYSAPLQSFDLLALPYALMLLTSTLGLERVCFGRTRAGVAFGALCFAVSILLKPIAIASALGVGLALLAMPGERWRLAWATAVGAGALGCAWWMLDLYSDGAFGELLVLQAERRASGGGFELMRRFPDMAGTIERQGIESVIAWNLRQHVHTFLSLSGWFPHLPGLALALGGQLVALGSRGVERGHRWLLAFAWLAPMAFSIFVWEPSFQTYFVQYLPAFSILGGLFAHWLWHRVPGDAGGRLARRCLRGATLIGVAFVVLVGIQHVSSQRFDTSLMQPRQDPGTRWLLFDPFMNFMTGTEPGCGLIDPFNVYGDRSLIALDPLGAAGEFYVVRETLIACLEADPQVRIGLGSWASWFVDEPLVRYLDTQPPERFVPMRLHYRGAGGGLPVSEELLRRRWKGL